MSGGSEDEFGISTTIVDSTDDSGDDIIDFEDISPGMDDKLEEEELKKQQQMPTATLPFGNPTTPATSSGSTGSIFGPPSAQQQQTNNWNPGTFGFTSNQNNSYIPPSSSIWNSNNNYSSWGNNNNNNSMDNKTIRWR